MNGNCGTKSELKLLQLRNECWFSPLKTCIHWIQILKWKFVPFSPYFEMENCSIESRFLTGKFFHWVLILIWEIVLLSPDSNIENCFIESSYPPEWKTHKAPTLQLQMWLFTNMSCISSHSFNIKLHIIHIYKILPELNYFLNSCLGY